MYEYVWRVLRGRTLIDIDEKNVPFYSPESISSDNKSLNKNFRLAWCLLSANETRPRLLRSCVNRGGWGVEINLKSVTDEVKTFTVNTFY